MEYTLEERGKLIIRDCLLEKGNDPVAIFKKIANKEYISIHGPEHHVLDGACLLTAFYNAGGNINLKESLEKLFGQGLLMPGATCGLWGVCGSVTSIGAALAIIDKTGPLTTDESWGDHMKFTSSAIAEMSKIGGPRCCKRDAFISFTEAIKYVKDTYDVELAASEIKCGFSKRNQQCIMQKCPYFIG